jgi:hypothetical protein
MINVNILQAKFNLYEVCFINFINFFTQNDKRHESILKTLHSEHKHIFRDIISNLLQKKYLIKNFVYNKIKT